jgi:hypothetical protein
MFSIDDQIRIIEEMIRNFKTNSELQGKTPDRDTLITLNLIRMQLYTTKRKELIKSIQNILK